MDVIDALNLMCQYTVSFFSCLYGCCLLSLPFNRDKLYQNKESGVSKSCAMPKKRVCLNILSKVSMLQFIDYLHKIWPFWSPFTVHVFQLR